MDEGWYYDEADFNVLEEIVHKAHLKEYCEKIRDEYNKIKETGVQDENLCQCVLDVENNGIRVITNQTSEKGRNICEGTLQYPHLHTVIKF